MYKASDKTVWKQKKHLVMWHMDLLEFVFIVIPILILQFFNKKSLMT